MLPLPNLYLASMTLPALKAKVNIFPPGELLSSYPSTGRNALGESLRHRGSFAARIDSGLLFNPGEILALGN